MLKNSTSIHSSRCWRVLYLVYVIKISVSFPTFVFLISHPFVSLPQLLLHLLCNFHSCYCWSCLYSVRQQVSSGLQNSSQYFGRSQSFCSQYGLGSYSDFQLFEYPSQASGNRSKLTNYNYCHDHSYTPQLFSFFLFFGEISGFVYPAIFLLFSNICLPDKKNPPDHEL